MRLLLTALLAAAFAAAPVRAVTVTDLAGRTVEIPAPPRRILLGVGIELPTLAIVDPDIVDRLVGIGTDLQRFEAGTYSLFAQAFPGLDRVPKTATGMGGVMSAEQALAARADLAIFSLWQRGRLGPTLAAFAKVGTPVIFVDFYDQPIANVPRSLTLLGAALGRPEAAKAYLDFYQERLERLASRLETVAGPRPRVFFQPLYNPRSCCWSAGRDSFGAFLAFLKAENLGAAAVSASSGGEVGLEYLLAGKPDIYITTGISTDAQDGQLAIGPGISPGRAQDGLAAIAATRSIAALPAARWHRVHAMWNFFNGSPLNILALEAMATWLYPDVFADIDPQASLDLIRERFLPVLEGTFWIGIDGAPGSPAGHVSARRSAGQ